MRYIKNIILIPLFVVLLQVLVLNQMHIAWYATPFLYIWLILRLPNELSRMWLITCGFALGMLMDVFCNTLGMHTLALTTMAFMKAPVLFLFVGREDFKTGVCSIQSMGLGIYFRFAITLTMIFTIVLFGVEAFSLHSLSVLLVKIVCSTISTTLLILGVEGLNWNKR